MTKAQAKAFKERWQAVNEAELEELRNTSIGQKLEQPSGIDIAAIAEVHPDLDVRRIRRWVRDFSDAMEMPEIVNDLESILSRRKKRKR